MKKGILAALLVMGLSYGVSATELVSPVDAKDIKLYKRLIKLCKRKNPALSIGKYSIDILSATKDDRQRQLKKLLYPSVGGRFDSASYCQSKSRALTKLDDAIIKSRNTESSFPELQSTMLVARKNFELIKKLVKKY